MSALGDIVANHGGLIQTGPFGSQLHEYEYTKVGVPVVMPKDIVSGKINFESIARIPEGKARQLQRHKLRAGDIVFPRRGDIGKCAFVSGRDEGCLCGTGCLKITVPESVLLPRFLFYFLGLPASVKWLENNSTGSTMMNLNTNTLGRLEIPDLPVEEQRRIADILSAYDDLIENNRRRIAILEETARLAYRKWFGGMEEGRTTTLGEVCQTFGGGTPKTSVPEFWDGNIPWVVPTDITRNTCLSVLDTERKITELGLQKSSAKMLPANAILMTSRASVGYFGIADFPVCTNQGFISIIPNDDSWRWYLLFNLMSRVEEIRSNAKGSTFPEISRARFRSMDVAIPEDNALIEFNNVVEPLMQQVRILAKQNAALATARDMLLPRLMKGEGM